MREGLPVSGFTLIELLVVVSIIAIALTLAAPSFSEATANQGARRVAFDLYTSLVLARNEAIKRNQTVTLNPKTGGWTAGWEVRTAIGGNQTILADFGPVTGIAISGPSTVQFARSGRASWTGTAPPFVISSQRVSTVDQRCLGLDLSGRPQLEKKPSCSG